MALTKNARNKLFKLVQQSKKLLYQEITGQLQQHYGIFPENGKLLLVEELTTSDADVIYKAKLLRDRLNYLSSNLADKKNEAIESIEQLIREQAFTILNRLAALRMAEERSIIKETIRKEYISEGFQVYDSITGQGVTASIFLRYKWYLNAIFDELAIDLPSIFDRFSPYAIIFPGEKSLLEIIKLINDEELSIHREEGFAPINLWQQDETIGWIYQYYNGKEEIKAMREASDAPRNSRELAVRNQFFTPRYVVQFLTDNSLGKIWYEMTNGNTSLKDCCPYLIKHPKELFLTQEENIPIKKDDGIHYIEYRQIKDPRELKLLDPACGSMHFGLYAFDLLEIIYLEAWDNHKYLLTDLKNKMTRSDFINQVPEFIIRYNIHGVDIDPRALQIAALSLWLRAQKSFDKLGLESSKRPQITKSNLVLAEPMPVNQAFLSELVKPLDAPMRKLVLDIWEIMKLAGETGLLLRIENEIDNKILEIVKNLGDESKKSQITIGADEEQLIAAEQSALYATKRYRAEFLDNAEQQVLDILKSLAENADNGNAYQKLLFADDSARGFAFIELCRQNYDVIVMNPPFGDASVMTESYLQMNYPEWGKNILAAFFDRALELINVNGLIGAIFDRTVAIKSSYEPFRIKCFCGHITAMADTGWNVLEANVETTTLCLKKDKSPYIGCYIDILNANEKGLELINIFFSLKNDIQTDRIYYRNSLDFEKLPNSIIGYYFDETSIKLFKEIKNLDQQGFSARKGNDFVSFTHYRNYWETIEHKYYTHLYNGGPYCTFYLAYREIIKSIFPEEYYKQHKSINLRNKEFQYQSGVGFGKFGDLIDAHIIKKGFMFTSEGLGITNLADDTGLQLNSFLNSIFSQKILNLFSGLHKQVGYINLLPFPFTEAFKNRNVIENILILKRKWFSLDETCLEFRHLLTEFSKSDSLKNRIDDLQKQLTDDKKLYLELIQANDDYWLDKAGIPDEEKHIFENYKAKRPFENLISIDRITDDKFQGNPALTYEIISNLMGIAFGRWDITSIINPQLDRSFGDVFEALPFMPIVSLKDVPNNYLISIPLDGILIGGFSSVNSISKSIIDALYKIWNSNSDKIIDELCEIGQMNSIEDFINNPNGFFDFHFKRYTKSRREAPIYWPISSAQGNYTVWLYYPRLNEQTLISVINNHLQPKIESVTDSIKQMSNNPNLDNKGIKELKFMQDFEHELQDMKKEILAISSLPYKPNHNDGVLITASPLCKLFRHSKWRKSTEECWKDLEKGEYDWTNIAFAIWPDRVKKKCKKDFSMAIAHGLENICENKPKEKKEKIKKLPKEVKKTLKLKFE